MSVHIAEVMQIFFCIVCGIPVMRTPLQILFLILVTDLPPSIALGMEPGESTILKERPRPRDEPVVLGWMWLSMVLNGAVLSAVIIAVYFVSLIHYCDGQILQTEIAQIEDYNSKLMDARTVAFISLVWSENIRSYTSRSFNRPVWNNILGNQQMQKAIILAQLCLYVAVLVPFFSDKILGLRGVAIGIFGWLLALVGPIGCLVLCEACKLITAYQVEQYQKGLAMRHLADDQRREEMALELANSAMGGPSKGPQKIGKATEELPSASSNKRDASRKLLGKDSAGRGSFLYGMCACIPSLFSSKKFDPVGVSGP